MRRFLRWLRAYLHYVYDLQAHDVRAAETDVQTHLNYLKHD